MRNRNHIYLLSNFIWIIAQHYTVISTQSIYGTQHHFIYQFNVDVNLAQGKICKTNNMPFQWYKDKIIFTHKDTYVTSYINKINFDYRSFISLLNINSLINLTNVLSIWKVKRLAFQHSKNEDNGIRSHHFMANRWGNNENRDRLYFLGLQNHCRWWLQPSFN